MRTSTELYHDSKPSSSRAITAAIEDGTLRIDLQDLWKGESPYDSDEYESSMYNINAKEVMALFDAASPKALLKELKRKFNTISAFDDISAFLGSNNIHYDYYSG